MTNQEFAKEIRNLIVETLYKSQSGHMGSNLSVADIVAVLYNSVLNVDPQNPEKEDRDRFILSKGHAGLSVDCALASKGFFPKDWLDGYYQNDGKLAGHITSHGVPGVELSAGSLGHGLPVGTGMALAAKLDKKDYRTFVVLSDGEMDEGSNWEPMSFASHHKLDNLVAICDYNNMQSMDTKDNTLSIEPFADRVKSFGWAVKEVNGNNVDELENALSQIPFEKGKPNFVIAHTIKGSGGNTGCDIFENKVEWHYKNLDEATYKNALKLLSQEKM